MKYNDLKQQDEFLKLFESNFEKNLNLIKVRCPLFVTTKSNLNDNHNDGKSSVGFTCAKGDYYEIIHSVAKWKRVALDQYDFPVGKGLYADMKGIRKDEEITPQHSYLVEQWAWEKTIKKENRTLDFLISQAQLVYKTWKETTDAFGNGDKYPNELKHITSEELMKMYPNVESSKERESLYAKEHKAIFVSQIGWPLSNGKAHDVRKADYDDWNLNGDIVIWYDQHNGGLELSSMGIRVEKESLIKQLDFLNQSNLVTIKYHDSIINGKLVSCIGGGIGLTRMIMAGLDYDSVSDVQTLNHF